MGQFIERSDWVSTVAFWYQTPAVGPKGPWPKAKDRIAPYTVMYAGKLDVRAKPNRGVTNDGTSINYMPLTGDAAIEFDFEIEKDGRYRIDALVQYSLYSSIYQPMLNGKPVGPELDMCYSGADPKWIRLDLHRLKKGTHTLRFEGRGASPNKRTSAPPAFAFGMAGISLLRLEDLTGYQESLKKELEKRKKK